MGIGLISLGFLLNFVGVVTINNQNIFPSYICYILVLIGVLLVKRRSNEKYFTYSLLPIFLMIVWQLLSSTNDNSQKTIISSMSNNHILYIVLTISIWYLVLQGIYKIPFDYQGKPRYKRRITIWLLLLILFNIPLINAIVIFSSLGFVGLVFFAYTLSITYNLACINKELEREYEEIVPVKSIPRKRVYTIFIIGLMITISISFILLEKPYTYIMEEVPYQHTEGSFFLQNKSIIIDNLALQSVMEGSNGINSTLIDPTIYLEQRMLSQAVSIEYTIYNNYESILEYQGSCIKNNTNSYYPGYDPLLIVYEDDFTYIDSNKVSSPLNITIDIKILDKENTIIYQLSNHPLNKAVSTKYSYEDNEISIKDLEVYNNQMIKSPSIHLKDKKIEELSLSLIGEQKATNFTYDFKGNNSNYVYGYITNVYFDNNSVQIKIVFDNHQEKIYTLESVS